MQFNIKYDLKQLISYTNDSNNNKQYIETSDSDECENDKMRPSSTSKLINLTKYRKNRSNRKRLEKIITKTPVLSEMLNLNLVTEQKPYILHFSTLDEKLMKEFKKTNVVKEGEYPKPKFKSIDSVSFDYKDYFLVEPEFSKSIESTGVDNSLFLAISRALLYKIYFMDLKYDFLLKNAYLKSVPVDETLVFDSDVKLQSLLRQALCIFWLSFVSDGNFKPFCKYSKNELFEKFALEDLAELLKVKILLFKLDSQQECFSVKLFESCIKLNVQVDDYLFIGVNEYGEYKWLMPKRSQEFINSTILHPANRRGAYYINIDENYSQQMILLNSTYLYKCFSADFLKQNVNFELFLKFLSEIAVHTLISLRNLTFDTLIKSNDSIEMINYLNRLWGQEHFNLKEVSNRIDLNKKQKPYEGVYKKNQTENINKFMSETELETNNKITMQKRSFSALYPINTLLTDPFLLKFNLENLLNQPVSNRFSIDSILNKFTMKSEPRIPKSETNSSHVTSSDLDESFDSSIPKSQANGTTSVTRADKKRSSMNKKRSLDTCLNSLMKLNNSNDKI